MTVLVVVIPHPKNPAREMRYGSNPKIMLDFAAIWTLLLDH